MADLILSRDEIFIQKIGDLPNAGTLNDADNIPISQNGVTKKSSISKVREGMVSDEEFADLVNSEITGSLIPESHLSKSWAVDGSNKGKLSVSDNVPEGHSGYSITLTHNGVSANANTNLIYAAIPAEVIKDDKQYTFTVWAKGNVPNLSITPLLKSISPTQETVGAQTQVITTEWKRYSFTFTPTKDYNDCRYEIRIGNNGLVGTFFLFEPRLDRGNSSNKISLNYDKAQGRLENKYINISDNSIRLYNNHDGRLPNISIGIRSGAKVAGGPEIPFAEREEPPTLAGSGTGIKFNHVKIYDSIRAWNLPIGTPTAKYAEVLKAYQEGYDVLYAVGFAHYDEPASLENIKNMIPEYENALLNLATVLRELDRPIYLTPLGEFNNAGCTYAFNYTGPDGSTNNEADFIPAWRAMVDKIRSFPGTENIKFEWHVNPFSRSFNQYDYRKWYPGDDYVDLVGISLYNTVGASGNRANRSFRERFKEFYYQVTSFCDKPIGVSEGTCFPDGNISQESITITNGGSGYTSPPTVTFSDPPFSDGERATGVAVISGGQVVGIDMLNMGWGYVNGNPTITFSGGGGSGAAATAVPIKVDREQWFADLFDSLKEFPRLTYWTFFFNNKEEGGIFNYFGPVIDAENEALARGYRRLALRNDNAPSSINKVIRPNLLKPWFKTNNWVQSNLTSTRTLSTSTDVPRDITNSGTSLRLPWNGSLGSPSISQIFQVIPFSDAKDSDKTHTLSFWAKIKPTTDNSVMDALINCYVWQNGPTFLTSNITTIRIDRVWRRYDVQICPKFSTVTDFWRVVISNEIPDNNKPYDLLLWGIKFEEGDFATDYIDTLSFTDTVNFTIPDNLVPAIQIQTPSGVRGDIRFTNLDGNRRWALFKDETSESGSNNGSNFILNAYDDSGNVLGTAISVNRATQNITLKGVTANSLTATDTVGINLNRNAGSRSEIRWNTASGDKRWALFKDETSESGSNAGSNLILNSYDDSGNVIGTPININRATLGISLKTITAESLTSTETVGVNLNRNSGSRSEIRWNDSSGNRRWALFKDETPETGSNVGSNLILSGYSDAGSLISPVLSFTRSTSNAQFYSTVTIPTLSLTNALTVANGGTGATSSSQARANLGTIASKNMTLTGNYTVLGSDSGTIFACDSSTGAFTITLPSSSSNPNVIYSFRRIDSSSNIVTIVTNGSDNILGQSTYTLTTARENITLISNSGVWVVQSRNSPTSGTAIASSATVTLNARSGRVTTQSLTTAAGGTYTLTINNSLVASNFVVLANIAGGTNTTGVPVLLSAVPGSGTITITIRNIDASAAFNGNLVIAYNIVN